VTGELRQTEVHGADHPAPIWYADEAAAVEEPTASHPATVETVEADPTRTLGEYRVDQLRRERYGGISWGAAFLGWLAAVGLGLLLLALAGAAAVGAFGLTGAGFELLEEEPAATAAGGAALIVLVALAAYLGGGYVAGRMTRYDGGRQGLGVWLCAAFGAMVLGAAAAFVGSEFGLLAELRPGEVPIDERVLTAGGLITLFAIVLGTRSAAILGGKAGQRYHERIDAYGSRSR
jgi:hypothetical protein